MKMSKVDIDLKAKNITFDLLCYAGLVSAKKIIMVVKKKLAAETKRRKNL